jgi:rod shape-determining protein MreD
MRAAAMIGLVAGFGLLVQTTLFHALPFGFHPSPDILVIVCVFLGLHRHTVGGAVGAFVLGYLQDAAAGRAAGQEAFVMRDGYGVV